MNQGEGVCLRVCVSLALSPLLSLLSHPLSIISCLRPFYQFPVSFHHSFFPNTSPFLMLLLFFFLTFLTCLSSVPSSPPSSPYLFSPLILLFDHPSLLTIQEKAFSPLKTLLALSRSLVHTCTYVQFIIIFFHFILFYTQFF